MAGNRQRPLAGKVNGYASSGALLCLMVTVMLCAMVMAQCHNVMLLRQSQQTSTFRLSLVDQAQAFWMDNAYKRKCGGGVPEESREVQIGSYNVILLDQGPCVQALWSDRTAEIFVDEQGIVEVDWQP